MRHRLSLVFAAILALAACGPKTSPTPAGSLPPVNNTAIEPLSGTVEVSIAGFVFDPAELTISVGTTVNCTNQDAATHTVVAIDNSWGSTNLGKGHTFSFTFSQAGTYEYRCGLHASMKGKITVVP